MKYISISFLPGSAGNFFSRCLNLLTGAYCYIDKNKNTIPNTIDEKLAILNYESVSNRSSNNKNWVAFETQVVSYSTVVSHYRLPESSYSIWAAHPHTSHGAVNLTKLAGPDDSCFRFYIDVGKHFEWACMNAFYKDSFLNPTWYINGNILLNDPTVYKINLGNFLKEWKEFQCEFKKVTDIIGHTVTTEELHAVEKLYHQWKTTILEYKDIENFKKTIGFFM
jgi:hypothetical protein